MKFKPSWLSSLVLGALTTTFIGLGQWQVDRAQEKIELEAAFASAGTLQVLPEDANIREFTRFELRGTLDAGKHILLDNQVWRGRAGVHVLTPFREAQSGRWLLVNRGWLPLGQDRSQLPKVSAPEGQIRFAGQARPYPVGGVRLGEPEQLQKDEWPQLVTYPDHEKFSNALGLPLSRWLLYMDPESAHGFEGRDWKVTRMGPDKHRGYALQWFALATTAGIAWIVLGVKRARELEA